MKQTAHLLLGETRIKWNRNQFHSNAILTEQWGHGGGGGGNTGLKGANKKQNTRLSMQTVVRTTCKYMKTFADKHLIYCCKNLRTLGKN